MLAESRSDEYSPKIVFPSITATDGCRQIGTTYAGFTTTLRPGELSSIRDGQTYSFNFNDLPCPPPSVHWTETGPYTPTLAFPTLLRDLDPAWRTCTPGFNQGIDPFTALPLVNKPLSPETSIGLFKMLKRGEQDYEQSRVVPRSTPATTTALEARTQ